MAANDDVIPMDCDDGPLQQQQPQQEIISDHGQRLLTCLFSQKDLKSAASIERLLLPAIEEATSSHSSPYYAFSGIFQALVHATQVI